MEIAVNTIWVFFIFLLFAFFKFGFGFDLDCRQYSPYHIKKRDNNIGTKLISNIFLCTSSTQALYTGEKNI